MNYEYMDEEPKPSYTKYVCITGTVIILVLLSIMGLLSLFLYLTSSHITDCMNSISGNDNFYQFSTYFPLNNINKIDIKNEISSISINVIGSADITDALQYELITKTAASSSKTRIEKVEESGHVTLRVKGPRNSIFTKSSFSRLNIYVPKKMDTVTLNVTSQGGEFYLFGVSLLEFAIDQEYGFVNSYKINCQQSYDVKINTGNALIHDCSIKGNLNTLLNKGNVKIIKGSAATVTNEMKSGNFSVNYLTINSKIKSRLDDGIQYINAQFTNVDNAHAEITGSKGKISTTIGCAKNITITLTEGDSQLVLNDCTGQFALELEQGEITIGGETSRITFTVDENNVKEGVIKKDGKYKANTYTMKGKIGKIKMHV